MAAQRKYDLYSPEFRANTHQIFAQIRRNDPVLQQPGIDGETPIWFISRYADVERALLDDATFVRDPALVSEELAAAYRSPDPQIEAMTAHHMLNRDGETHRRLRSLVTKAFTPKVVRDMRPRIEAIAAGLLERVAARGRMELVADFAYPLPITVIAELLGIPLERQEDFRRWSSAAVRPAITPAEMATADRLLGEFVAFMGQLAAERRLAPGQDLLSGLIHAEEQGQRLNQGELFSMILLLIIAGHETTVSFIGNAVLALLQHPAAWQALGEDPALIPEAIEELLRYDSPVERALTRFAAADAEVGGQQIRRGDLVIVIMGSANRDEAVFDEPATLDLRRGRNPHLAFGKGAHYCLGAPLARLEAEIALHALRQRFPDLALDIEPADLRWRDVPNFRSLVRLPVRWPL